MKKLLSGAAVAVIIGLALPAWSQTSQVPGRSTQHFAPGHDGASGAGVPGLPGNKSGPTMTPSGTTAPETKTHPSGDQSGIQGLPGNKSGPAVTPSGAGR